MDDKLDEAWEDLRCELELTCGIELPPDRPVTAWGPAEKVKTIRLALEDKRLSDRLLVEKSTRIHELENKIRKIEAKIAKELADKAALETFQREEREKGYQAGLKDQGYRPTSTSWVEGYESGELARVRKQRSDA